MTKPPIASGRLVWTVIAITFAVAAIKCWGELKRMNIEHWQIANARPVNIAVDLSKPGEIKAPYWQTHDPTHGEIVELQLSPKLKSDEDPKEVLAELAGEFVIASLDGKPILSRQFNHESLERWHDQGVLVMLAALEPFPAGNYEMTFRVDTGAEFLADTEQRLVVRYVVCSCGMMVVLILGGILIGASVIALTSARSEIHFLLKCVRKTWLAVVAE